MRTIEARLARFDRPIPWRTEWPRIADRPSSAMRKRPWSLYLAQAHYRRLFRRVRGLYLGVRHEAEEILRDWLVEFLPATPMVDFVRDRPAPYLDAGTFTIGLVFARDLPCWRLSVQA